MCSKEITLYQFTPNPSTLRTMWFAFDTFTKYHTCLVISLLQFEECINKSDIYIYIYTLKIVAYYSRMISILIEICGFLWPTETPQWPLSSIIVFKAPFPPVYLSNYSKLTRNSLMYMVSQIYVNHSRYKQIYVSMFI